MAKFHRYQVFTKMNETGLVPVFYHPDIEICKEVVHACYKGGVRVFEFTNRGDFAHEVFSELNKFINTSYPDLILGVGSVIDAGTSAIYLQAGTNFIVSPVLKEEMARICNRRKVLWVPGCGSLTEISKAEELGAEVVKIFPASSVGGPDFVKAIKGPSPWTNIMPTGGVTTDEDNLKSWFNAGVTSVGIGSQLITKEILTNKDFHLLEEKTSRAIQIIQSIKSNT
ncbi:MAG: bifunctional 4-hydroxy-2-oxoglutarate aldolase/2-dehydro-3-deoxy-phosphogluconate aldolase [Bacteroidetes bacterium]|nr:MAG: bifunctional 4-hydroxy-2-oxoglutarate aldolase/2-dehydro-3-deoxy-phosphogluconate aldolase [Bacteroidota bacterium]